MKAYQEQFTNVLREGTIHVAMRNLMKMGHVYISIQVT